MKEKEPSLADLVPTKADKAMIEDVLQDQDPKWQNSQFIGFLRELGKV